MEIDKHTVEAMTRIIDYIYDDESKHFAETEEENRRDHIFTHIRLVSGWLEDHMK